MAAFYAGKSIRLVVGVDVGSGYDANARLLARHIGKHIPGRPSVVAQNMPGAGSVKAANYVFSVAPKDGSVIGTMSRSVPVEPLLGDIEDFIGKQLDVDQAQKSDEFFEILDQIDLKAMRQPMQISNIIQDLLRDRAKRHLAPLLGSAAEDSYGFHTAAQIALDYLKEILDTLHPTNPAPLLEKRLVDTSRDFERYVQEGLQKDASQ